MQTTGKATPTTTHGQTVNQVIPGQSPADQAADTRMSGLEEVQQRIAALRETLHTLMLDKQYADGEIITAAATLDAQLEDCYRTLSDKQQPAMRTY